MHLDVQSMLGGDLREKPDINITSVVSTYSTIPVPVSDEPFGCFIPQSIITMVKGLIYHHLRARGSCAQPWKYTSYYHFRSMTLRNLA
jgi:hypothetical protein